MEDTKLKITPEFVIELIIRRRWMIMIPFCCALIAGMYLAITLPKVFEAKTLILVESQRVPQNYVQSIVTEDTAQRINTISQQILSRTNLEKIIRDFNLFSGPAYESMYLEDKVGSLRKRISIDVITDRRRETEAFTITYKGKTPEKVMQVANGLASYFIEENLRVRESQAIGTSDFLEAELETMRVKLEQVEESIKNYRKANMGELPEQLETNLRILERLQEDLSNRQESLRDARSRLSALNRQATTREPSVVVIGGGQTQSEGTASIEELRTQLETLQSRYTERHPDIIRIKRQIAELESHSDEGASQGESQRMSRHVPIELRRQIAEAKREIQLAEQEIESLRAQIFQYQNRIENIPKREQELLGLRRDYQNIQTTYESLLTRKLEADIAVNMERKQKGEQFRIIDPAKAPQRPIEPDLRKLFVIVVALGFGIGGGAALLIEFLKPSYRRPEEIEEQFEMPVLVMIPQLLKPKEVLLRKVNIASSVVFTVLLVCLFGIYGVISLLGPENLLKSFN